MNCKPGDIAKCIKPGRYYGVLVEILYAAPPERFRLPDGFWHTAGESGDWVIRILGLPLLARCGLTVREAFYGVGRDIHLRPIRPGEEPEAIDTDEPIEVTA